MKGQQEMTSREAIKIITPEQVRLMLSVLNGRGPLRIESRSSPRLTQTKENRFECLVNTKEFQITIRQGSDQWATIIMESIKATSP
jgi:hypothetical protein